MPHVASGSNAAYQLNFSRSQPVDRWMSVFFFYLQGLFSPIMNRGKFTDLTISYVESGPSCPWRFFFFEYHAICIDGLINNSVVSIEYLVPFPSSENFLFCFTKKALFGGWSLVRNLRHRLCIYVAQAYR